MFVDKIQQASIEVRYKSHLVPQNYGDDDAATIARKAPTVRRFTKRLVLSLPASIIETGAQTRVITPADLQPTQKLERDVFTIPAKEMCVRPDQVLKVVKPLYGFSE